MANKSTNKKVQSVQVKEETIAVEDSHVVAVKRIVFSKTIWVNLIAFIAFWVQKQYGFVISEDLQMQALTLINIALRFVTKEAIAWGGADGTSEENS
jgi:hypothetical protein